MLLSLSLIRAVTNLNLFYQTRSPNSGTDTRSAIAILAKNQIAASALPLKIRELLDHKEKMTLVLKEKKNSGNPIEIEVLSSSTDSSEYIRTVILKDERSKKVLSLGIIKIDLAQLKDYHGLEYEVIKAKTPFGQLLENYNLAVTGNPDTFYKINAPDDKKQLFSFLPESSRKAFDLDSNLPIFGRHNTLTRNDTQAKIAEVYEFLAV